MNDPSDDQDPSKNGMFSLPLVSFSTGLFAAYREMEGQEQSLAPSSTL